MSLASETSLVAKVLWSAAIVLGLSAIAERVGTRVAGVLSGAPLNAVLVYFFVGRDLGTDYAVTSTPHGIAAFTATLAFVLAYHRASVWFTRFTVPLSAAASVAVFVAVARGLVLVPFTLAQATAMTVCFMALAIWLFRRIEFANVTRPVRYTARLILLRAGLAACLIVGAITLAELLGPRWTGVLAGFPATLLPTLLIIHLTYGRASTHAIIRSFPVGMGSIILYILSVRFAFPAWGVYAGTTVSLCVSAVYLTTVLIWRHARSGRQAARARR